MKLFCFRTITTKSRAPNVVVPNLFKIDEHSAPLLDPDTANDVEDDGLDKKTKPIPFLIRNTTADGMPISIGSLRAVSTPAFSSFNPFLLPRSTFSSRARFCLGTWWTHTTISAPSSAAR